MDSDSEGEEREQQRGEVAGAKEAVSGVLWTMATCPGWGGSWWEMGQSGQAVARGFPVSAEGVGQGCGWGWRVEVPEQGSNR